MFGTPDDDDLAMLVHGLTDAFKQYTNRITINGPVSITETLRPALNTTTLFLHAYVDASEDITVTEYSRGAASQAYVKTTDFVVAADQYAARLDMLASQFAAGGPGRYTTVEYTGGWPVLPGAVLAGALMQGRVMLKRTKGDAGARQRSHRQEKRADIDNRGIIREAADLWRPFKVMI